MDKSKVEAIHKSPKLKTITNINSLCSLALFNKMFVPNFSIIMALIVKCMKKSQFEWNSITNESFVVIKQKLSEVFILTLLDFDKFFKVECDASRVGIGVVHT